MFIVDRTVLVTAMVAALAFLWHALSAAGPLPEAPAEPFFICRGGLEYLAYQDPRTGRQGVAQVHDLGRGGWKPRTCEGTPEERMARGQEG